MNERGIMNGRLALALAATIRHDGSGVVTDDLDDTAGTARWLASTADLLPDGTVPPVDEELHTHVVTLRGAIRSLLARATAPADTPPPPDHEALTLLNAAAARQAVIPRLLWDSPNAPTVEFTPGGTCPDTIAALARAAITLLQGPDRERLRICAAPRCERYFIRTHGRQQWCGTACGNRARAARHYRRHAAART